MSDEPTAEPTSDDVPAALDPYFTKKDGTAFTGGDEPAPDPEKTPTEPAPKPEPEKQAAKPKAEEEKRKETIGQAWKEVRNARREAQEAVRQAQASQAQAEQQRAELDHIVKSIKSDFRGWAKQNGLSLRELIEADLKESDQDPKEKEVAAVKGEVSELKALLTELKQERERAQQATMQEQEQTQLVTQAQANAEDYPRLAAYAEKWAPAMWNHWYATERETGRELPAHELFRQFEEHLTEIGVALPESASPASGQQGKNGQSALRGGAVKPAKRVVGTADDDGNDAVSGTAPAITNRLAAERASNGKPMTRAERQARAASRIQFRN